MDKLPTHTNKREVLVMPMKNLGLLSGSPPNSLPEKIKLELGPKEKKNQLRFK